MHVYTHTCAHIRVYAGMHAIPQILHLLSCISEGSTAGVSSFVLEFSDAFWQIPLSPAEQKHFCATGLIAGRRKWIAFQRTAQGSTAAPTLWGRLAGLVMRLTQPLFDASKLRLVCYVDDPLAAILCEEEERRTMTTLMVLIWAALGFKLAFSRRPARHAGHLDRRHALD